MLALLKRLVGPQAPAAVLLSPAEFEAGLKHTAKAQLLDVRFPHEYSAGHLKQARNCNVLGPDFEAQLKALDPQRPVFVYCRSGRRSQTAAKRLKRAGFHEIYDLQGGYLAWQQYQQN